MPKLYRDATTGQKTVEARHETPDVAELRRLLAAYRAASGLAPIVDAWYEVARAAHAALPALLDADAERDRLARLLDEPRRSGCAVEIAGVRIAPCDERGQTADMRERDALRAELAHMREARDAARAEVDALAAKVARVRALHRAVSIYDECDCDAPDPATHFDVDDVGLTCNLMYRVCAECCRDNMYQTEGCASYHAHHIDEDYHCPTIRALDEEPQP